MENVGNGGKTNAKILRLGRILALLQQYGTLSISQLSEKLNVSVRTLQRDMCGQLVGKVVRSKGGLKLATNTNNTRMQILRDFGESMGQDFSLWLREITQPTPPQDSSTNADRNAQANPSTNEQDSATSAIKVSYTLNERKYKMRLIPQEVFFYDGEYWLRGFNEDGAQRIQLSAITKMKPIK